MKLTELFLGELDREAVITRRAIERVPVGRDDWKPHARSMPLGRLAGLVAAMPGWITMMIERDDLDLNRREDPGIRSRRSARRRSSPFATAVTSTR